MNRKDILYSDYLQIGSVSTEEKNENNPDRRSVRDNH